MDTAAAGIGHPTLLVKEVPGAVEVFLVCEDHVLTGCTGMEAPIVLLAAYYFFNVSYPKGTVSFFTALEIKLCDQLKRKFPATVSNFIMGLK